MADGTDQTRAPETSGEADEGPIGPFPTWTALYWTIVFYTGLLIAGLHWMTTALDHSAR